MIDNRSTPMAAILGKVTIQKNISVKAACAAIYTLDKLKSLIRPSSLSSGCVVALHDIGDSSRFQEVIKKLQRLASIRKLSEVLAEPDKPGIALTFDDGYQNWVTNVLPVLRRMQISATFFINAGSIGLTGEEARQFIEEKLKRKRNLDLLSIEGFAELAKEPLVEIGGHATSHVDLGSISDERVWESELKEEREQLEALSGRKVRYFAYPFGAESNIPADPHQRLRQCGYEAAFTIIPGMISRSSDQYQLPRCSLDIEEPWYVWRAKLSNDWHALSRMKRRIVA